MDTTKELIPANGANAELIEIDIFTKRLNTAPPATEVAINKFSDNSKYLPISFVQMRLDEIFLGLWSWEVSAVQVIANEVLVWGNLKVFHPVVKQWITRSGTGAAMILQNKGADITDIGAKIKNTLVKDFPHAEAEALKSAAKKLGKAFGRDLNRQLEDHYESEYFAPEKPPVNVEVLKKSIAKCKNRAELTALYKLDERHAEYADLFTARKDELSK